MGPHGRVYRYTAPVVMLTFGETFPGAQFER